MSAQLDDLAARIATNTLTVVQQNALQQALLVISPAFPSPDESSSADAPPDALLAREWIAALYAIQALSGGVIPVSPTTLSTVANIAALGALSTVSLADGSEAFVQTVGAYWTLESTSTATIDGITVIAAAGGGRWVRTVSAVTQAAIAQALWVIDPANVSLAASDENPGSLVAPLSSVAEVTRRMGTLFPKLAQATIIQWISNGVATDPYDLEAEFVGAGSMTLLGTPTVATTTTIGVFTPQNRATATPATLTAVGVLAWTVGQVIVDTTAGAIFFVTADLGAGVAQVTLPVANTLGGAPAAVAIANGDTIQLQTYQRFFSSRLKNRGAGPFGANLNVIRLNVRATVSNLETSCVGFQGCVLSNAFVQETGPFSQYSACICLANGGSCILQGGSVVVTAGAILGNFGILPGRNGVNSVLNGDVLVLGTSHNAQGGILQIGAAYLQGPFNNQTPATSFATIASTYGPGGRPVIWGPAIFNVANGAQCSVASATAAQLFLNTGGLQLDGAAAGSTFVPGTGLWSVGTVALTPAAVDANGALMNPKTNSRIHV